MQKKRKEKISLSLNNLVKQLGTVVFSKLWPTNSNSI